MPLRLRVTLLYIALGLVMSVLFAATVAFVAERYEQVLVGEILHSQAQDYAVRLRHEPDAILPRSRRLSGYLRHRDGSGAVPAALATLPPGVHESPHEDEDGLHMAVFDTAVGRLFFVINLSGIERLEHYVHLVLAAVVLLGTLLSAWLGWLLSGNVVGPVRRLADVVEALPPVPVRTGLAATLPRDELGRLGAAIDGYQARLVAAQDAERAFFADASHELRTPIAVVRGATELLLEDGAGMPGLQPRLQRLDRGVRQLSELLDALLGLARRRIGASETVVLRDWVAGCLAGADAVREGRVQWRIEGGNPKRALPLREATLVLNGSLRRLLPAEARGCLVAEIAEARIALRLLADAVAPLPTAPAPAAGSDRGFGLTLLGRLATQLGWRLEEDAARRAMRIHLAPATPSPDATDARMA